MRGELRESLEFLRRAESDLLTTSWPDYQESDDHNHLLLYTWSADKGLPAEWSRVIGEIRIFVYDLLPDPTQSALARVERSELAISATMEATVRQFQDSMLTIGDMVVAELAQHESDSTEVSIVGWMQSRTGSPRLRMLPSSAVNLLEANDAYCEATPRSSRKRLVALQPPWIIGEEWTS